MIEGCFVTASFMLYKKIGILILSYRFWFKQLFENRGPMKTTRSFGEYPKYSLHDARVQKIEYVDDSLIFTFDYIFFMRMVLNRLIRLRLYLRNVMLMI